MNDPKQFTITSAQKSFFQIVRLSKKSEQKIFVCIPLSAGAKNN